MKCRPQDGESDLRSWEWRYLWKICHQELKAVGRHDGPAYGLCFSPDESRVASSGEDGVRIWECESFQLVKHLTNHQADVNSVHFSPEGSRLVTASDDRTVKIWSAVSWSVEQTFSYENRVVAAKFAPHGRLLAVAERGYAPEQNRISVYEVDSWRLVRSWQAHKGRIQNMAFSPDSLQLASVGDDGMCYVWDWMIEADPPRVNSLKGSRDLIALTYLPVAGNLVIGGHDGNLIVWNSLARSSNVTRISAHASSIEAISSCNGEYVVSASRTGTAKVWRIDVSGTLDEEPVAVFKTRRSLWNARLDSVGNVYLANRDGLILRTSLDDGSGAPLPFRAAGAECYNTSIVFLEQGERFAKGRCGVKIYETATGRLMHVLIPNAGGEHRDCRLAVSQDGTRLATSTEGGDVQVWDAETFRLLRSWSGRQLFGQEPPKFDVGLLLNLSPDGRYVVPFATDRVTLKLDVHTGEISQFETRGLQEIRWSPDRRYRTQKVTVPGHPIEVVEEETGRILPLQMPDGVAITSWSPKGHLLAAVTWEGDVYLWDTETWNETAHFNAAPQGSISIDFSADGRTLAVAGGWGDIHLWNISTQRELLRLHAPVSVFRSMELSFSPDGKTLGVGGPIDDSGHVWLWSTQYRNGQYQEAIDALLESERLGAESSQGSSSRPFNGFFLAMSYWQLGEHVSAREWFQKAVEAMKADNPDDPELIRFREEAEELLNMQEPMTEL